MPVETVTREEELHWLALRLIPGLGTRNAGKLVARFRSAREVFRASRTELEGAGGWSGMRASEFKVLMT